VYLTGQIRVLEAEIDELRAMQDRQVKQVWAGYTRRWGPATLGVQRGPWIASVENRQAREDDGGLLEHRRRDTDQGFTMSDDEDDVRVLGVVDGEHADLGDEGLSTASNDITSATNREELLSRSVSRNGRCTASSTRTGTSMTTSSTTSQRDLPGSRAPGEGKMRVGWIRE